MRDRTNTSMLNLIKSTFFQETSQLCIMLRVHVYVCTRIVENEKQFARRFNFKLDWRYFPELILGHESVQIGSRDIPLWLIRNSDPWTLDSQVGSQG